MRKMITRNARRRTSNSDCRTVALRNSRRNKKSLLNVHIHMPNSDVNNIKILVPDRQPIVHFHFKGDPKNLKLIVGKQNTKDICEIQMCGSNSRREDDLETENKRSRASLMHVTGEDANEVKNNIINSETGIVSNSNSKCDWSYKSNGNESIGSIKNNSSSNSCEINKEISNWSIFKNDAKLTKAVVVVTDIFKTNCSEDENDAKEENKGTGISAAEQEMLVSTSRNIVSCSGNITDDRVDIKPFEALNFSPTSSKILTRLAEGCNFSEILNRFRFNYGRYFLDYPSWSDTTNSKSCSESAREGADELKRTESFNETLDEHEKQKSKFGTSNLHDDLENTGDLLTPKFEESTENADSDNGKLCDPKKGTNCRDSLKDTRNSLDQFQDSDMTTDNNGCTTLVQACSGRVSADQETVDSSRLTSNVLDNGSSNVSEMHNNSSFGIIAKRMEMQRKKLQKNNKGLSQSLKKEKRPKSQPKKSNRSKPAKKMKKSKETNRKLPAKGLKSVAPDYIPLQVSGPTKFGVAVLSKIEPFKQHDAKDFKNKMLFGDRVKRYSSSQDLQKYKLKKEAVRHVKESSKK